MGTVKLEEILQTQDRGNEIWYRFRDRDIGPLLPRPEGAEEFDVDWEFDRLASAILLRLIGPTDRVEFIGDWATFSFSMNKLLSRLSCRNRHRLKKKHGFSYGIFAHVVMDGLLFKAVLRREMKECAYGPDAEFSIRCNFSLPTNGGMPSVLEHKGPITLQYCCRIVEVGAARDQSIRLLELIQDVFRTRGIFG